MIELGPRDLEPLPHDPHCILVDEDATDGDAKDEDATNQDVISLSFYYERFPNKNLVQNPVFFLPG